MITLQFSTSDDLGSAFIRFFTWSEFSHVDLILPDGSLLGARIDGGVKIRPANYATFSKTARYQANGPDSVIDYAKSQIGKPYDAKSIVNFGLHRDWRKEDSWFCSELVAAAFEQAGYPLVVGDARRITPRDLTLSTRLMRVA